MRPFRVPVADPSVFSAQPVGQSDAKERKRQGKLIKNKVVKAMYTRLCEEVEEVLMKEVKWREKATLAEKWARRRREGGESDGGCWMA